MGLGSGRELQEGEDICIPMADSCGCMAETNTHIVKQLSFNRNKYILLKKKNPACNARYTVLKPGWGTKIPRAMEQLSLPATTRDSKCCHERRILRDAVKILSATTKT